MRQPCCGALTWTGILHRPDCPLETAKQIHPSSWDRLCSHHGEPVLTCEGCIRNGELDDERTVVR
jgi:hypothetical protein